MKISKHAAALAALLLAIGCKSDSTAPSDTTAGNYVLATVNGGGLPAIIGENSAGRLTINSGTMLLRDDKSYVNTRNFVVTLTTGEATPTTTIDPGNYAVVGTQITFTIPVSEIGGTVPFSYTGAVASGVLSYTYSGISYVYRKP